MIKALDAIDIAPFYSQAKSSIDLEIITIFQHGMLCASVNNLLAREVITDFKYSKVAYHAYELALNGWYEKKGKVNRAEKTSDLKIKAMEGLLSDASSSLFDISTLVAPGFSHMKRNWQGFLAPINQLHFPETESIQRFSSFKGFTFDRKNKTIEFITENVEVLDPTTGETVPNILFTSYDIAQMIQKGITGVQFSLDAPEYGILNPLQKVVVRPENVRNTGYYQTLFMADYLLKMFTTGVEVSGLPPYITKTNNDLIERLLPELKDILNLLRTAKKRGEQAHRFWITTKEEGSIEHLKSTNEDGVLTVLLGDVELELKKHLLKLQFNAEGIPELSDATLDQDDDSPEARFAKLFTENYDKIGAYFPEFLRLKELLKIAAAITQLKEIRLKNNYKIHKIETILADEPHWESLLKLTLENISKQLLTIYQGQHSLVKELRPASDTDWWVQKQKVFFETHRKNLQDAARRHPQFSYQINDSEVTRVYNAHYGRVYNDFFNQLFESNKARIITEHGQESWNYNESSIRQQVTTAVQASMPTLINNQKILNELNQLGAKTRAEIKNQYNTQLSNLRKSLGESTFSQCLDQFLNGNPIKLAEALANDEKSQLVDLYEKISTNFYNSFLEARSQIGEVAYKHCIEQLMQGNVSSLANPLAQNQIASSKEFFRAKIQKKQEVENMFLSLGLNSDIVADEDLEEQSHDYFVPAAYHCHTNGNSSYRVYGGVRAVIVPKNN